MKKYTRFTIFIFFTIFCRTVFSQNLIDILSVPAENKFSQINIGATTILPSGRFITPAGNLIRITNDPFGMAISADGKKCVTLHNGVFTFIDLKTLDAIRVPGYDNKIKSPLSKGSFLGVAFSKDSKTLYLSGGDNGAVIIYDIGNFTRIDSISLNGTVDGVDFEDSFTSDLVYNETNNELLVLDRGNFRMVRVDLALKRITASVKVGRQPFGLTLSPDKKTAFIANVGMYEYPLIKGATPRLWLIIIWLSEGYYIFCHVQNTGKICW